MGEARKVWMAPLGTPVPEVWPPPFGSGWALIGEVTLEEDMTFEEPGPVVAISILTDGTDRDGTVGS